MPRWPRRWLSAEGAATVERTRPQSRDSIDRKDGEGRKETDGIDRKDGEEGKSRTIDRKTGKTAKSRTASTAKTGKAPKPDGIDHKDGQGGKETDGIDRKRRERRQSRTIDRNTGKTAKPGRFECDVAARSGRGNGGRRPLFPRPYASFYVAVDAVLAAPWLKPFLAG